MVQVQQGEPQSTGSNAGVFLSPLLPSRTKKEARQECLAFRCGRDDSTRTSDPYVPNVVRYQLRYIPLLIKNKLLGELVNIHLETALEVGRFVFVDNPDFGEFVNHGIDLGSILLGCSLICCVAEVADGVPRGLCIILVMQAVTLALTGGTCGGFSVCHYFTFLYLVVGRRIELLLQE